MRDAAAADDAPADSGAGDEPLRPGSTPLRVDLTLETDDLDPPLAGWLDVQLARLATLAGVAAGDVGLVVVDDAQMTGLHERYRGEATTTDVLSFDLGDDDAAGPGEPTSAQGDIVLCLDEARRQAAARGHDVRLELLLYSLHGLLHLLGEDDVDPNAAARMHAREDAILTEAGFGPIYAPAPAPATTPAVTHNKRATPRAGDAPDDPGAD
ncbi:MAG: rRNA maturation RNase YbeY [Phycisphaeraceae bacterium]